jgi:hypothetical protein
MLFILTLFLVEADYQRDVVWNDAKQSGLIDSVYRDYCEFLLVYNTIW